MSCTPPYNYRPTMPPVADCSAPTFAEHRSRLFAGGTYFRSIEQGPQWNDISIEVEQIGSPITYDLTVSYQGIVKETYNVTQVPDGGGGCNISGIDLLRTAINGISSYIEMYQRGGDFIFDSGGTDDDCLSIFNETYMSGGSGSPVDASELTKIHTGHERTMIIISTTERQNGTPTNPPAERHVQQWGGSNWIPYQNFVPGECPSTTLIGVPYVVDVVIEDEPEIITIVIDGASRRWSDGTYAANANEYLNPPIGYSYEGDVGDGLYAIDPDQLGTPFDVYADMTNDGGGWMRVIDGPSTTLGELDVFGDVSIITSTYYSDPTYGVGWGDNSDLANWSLDATRYTIDAVDFSEMRVTLTGFYAGGMGRIRVMTSSGVVTTHINDAWAIDSSGQSYRVNGVDIFYKQLIDVVNQPEILIGFDRNSQISMTGYSPSYVYTKRYINQLWLR